MVVEGMVGMELEVGTRFLEEELEGKVVVGGMEGRVQVEGTKCLVEGLEGKVVEEGMEVMEQVVGIIEKDRRLGCHHYKMIHLGYAIAL